MKIAISAGHTASGAGYGAVGYFKESIETRKIVQELIPLLKKKGHTVIDATVDRASTQLDYLQKSVQIANKAKADLFLTVHLNAGGGNGCEAYTWKGYKYKEAVNICAELQAEGFRNRGVKDGSGFYVIKKTTMTAILLEVCFLDNRKDCQLYQKVGVKKIAQAIADGIS
jgi:N-acetylmuramoyl-L-alanine amidase